MRMKFPYLIHQTPTKRSNRKSWISCDTQRDYPDKSDEEIKELFKADLPLKEYVKAGFNLNIYWIRRGVKGVGCGVTSREEGKDVGFYGYRTQCECWVVAMAAALKSCDIFCTFYALETICHYILEVGSCDHTCACLLRAGFKRKSM